MARRGAPTASSRSSRGDSTPRSSARVWMPWRTERRTLRAAMTGGGKRLAGRVARALFGCAALAGSFASAAHAAVLPTGRPVAPAGHVPALQSFPTGAAVNPNGRTVLAIAGPVIQGGAPAGPNGGVALMVVDAVTGEVRQTLNVDDAFQGVAYDHAGTHAYVAGGAGNTVHVFSVAPDGTLSQEDDLPAAGFVADIALSRGGRTLWAAEPTQDAVERMDLRNGGRATKIAASSPDQVALSADGRRLFASDWRGSCVTVIPAGGTTGQCIQVGEHPTGVAAAGGNVLAADSNDATLAVIDPRSMRSRLLSLAQVGHRSDAPNDVVLARDGRTAYVSLGGDDAVAVMKLRYPRAIRRRVSTARRRGGHRRRRDERVYVPPKPRWKLAGLIPTGWYPTALALSPDGRTLHVITARGLGHSAAATQPYQEPDPAALVPDGAYGTVGTLESIRVPSGAALAGYTAQVRRYLRKRGAAGAP